jgi:hypothetical protein
MMKYLHLILEPLIVVLTAALGKVNDFCRKRLFITLRFVSDTSVAAIAVVVSVYDVVVTEIYRDVMTERSHMGEYCGTESNPFALSLLDSGQLVEAKSAGLLVAFVGLIVLSRTRYRWIVYLTLLAQLSLFVWLNFAVPSTPGVTRSSAESDLLRVCTDVVDFYLTWLVSLNTFFVT